MITTMPESDRVEFTFVGQLATVNGEPVQPVASPSPVRLARGPLRIGLLVTGSRNWRAPQEVNRAIDWPDGPITLIHGGAKGADLQMARHAADQGWTVLPPFLPDYQRFSTKTAPLIRNGQMVQALAQLLASGRVDLVVCLAFWRDHSGGTGYTRDRALEAGIPVVTYYDCACHERPAELGL
jgi:hypothetical protein